MKSLPVETDIEFDLTDLIKIQKKTNNRYELINGVIYVMAGCNIEHGILTTSLASILKNVYSDKPCLVVTESLKLKLSSEYGVNVFLPDIGVICNPIRETDGYFENPIILVEILSKSTQYKDRTLKLFSYLKIPSLIGYLAVEQNQCRVECYRRSDIGISVDTFSENDNIELDSKTSISVNEIYCDLKKYNTLKGD